MSASTKKPSRSTEKPFAALIGALSRSGSSCHYEFERSIARTNEFAAHVEFAARVFAPFMIANGVLNNGNGSVDDLIAAFAEARLQPYEVQVEEVKRVASEPDAVKRNDELGATAWRTWNKGAWAGYLLGLAVAQRMHSGPFGGGR